MFSSCDFCKNRQIFLCREYLLINFVHLHHLSKPFFVFKKKKKLKIKLNIKNQVRDKIENLSIYVFVFETVILYAWFKNGLNDLKMLLSLFRNICKIFSREKKNRYNFMKCKLCHLISVRN